MTICSHSLPKPFVVMVVACAAWSASSGVTYSQTPAAASAAARIQEAADRAIAHQTDGRMGEFVGEMQDAVRLAERTFGPDSPDTAQVLNVLGMVYEAKGRDGDAEATFKRALAIAEAHAGPADNVMITTLQNLAQIVVKRDRARDAVPMFERALKVAEAKFGPVSPDTAPIQLNLARAYIAVGKAADAVQPANRALKAIEGRDGADAASTIPFRTASGMALEGLGRYNEAEALYKKSMAIADAKLPPGAPFAQLAANALEHLYQVTGRTKEAAPANDRVMRGQANGPGVNPSDDATVLHNLAMKHLQEGRPNEAVPLELRALVLSEQRNGRTHALTIAILASLAETLKQLARHNEAELYARRGLAARADTPGPDDLAMTLCRKTLAEICLLTGRAAEAVPLLRQALASMERLKGPDHVDAASILNALAYASCLAHNYKDGLEFSRRALGIVEAKLGPDNRLAGSIRLALGQSYAGLRQYAEAERELQKALAVLEREAGHDHSETAAARNNLAAVRSMSKRAPEVVNDLRKSAETIEERLGPDHPDAVAAYSNLALVHARSGRWPEALKAYDRSRRIRRNFVEQTLPGLGEQDQFALLAFNEDLWGALSLALDRRDDPGAANRSAAWVVNSKGGTVEALAQRAWLAHGDGRKGNNSQVATIALNLKRARDRLAALRRDQPGGSDANRQTLETEERELSRQLGLALAGAGRRPVPWVTTEALRATLPTDAVLIEFARFFVIDLAQPSGTPAVRPARYAAWIIPPTGKADVRLIDLGPASVIEQAIAAVVRGVPLDAQNYLAHGEPGEEQRVAPALGDLARLVLGPLRNEIDSALRWVISPDGPLWVVPWAALTVEPGVYAVERHVIHLVISGRDLVAATMRTAAPKHDERPAIIADPDFDFRPSAIPPASAPVPGADTSEPGLVASREGFMRAPAIPLKFSAAEAQEVAPRLKKFAGVAPVVYQGSAATEAAFKRLRGPRVLLLSTHGNFLENPEPSAGSAARSIAGDGLPANPLLRCALLFAGVNRFVGAPEGPPPGEEDGVLTGLEIVGTDLRGTDLVVLSACETGLGELRVGEGVAGLRQAFQIAGATSVVSSLWNVDDEATANLVADFFDELSTGQDPASALRGAQVRRIADRRQIMGGANPYFWAAFSITGRPPASWIKESVKTIAPPAVVSKASGGPPASRSTPPAQGLWPGTDREGHDHPIIEGMILTLVIASCAAGSRWWWRLGQPGR